MASIVKNSRLIFVDSEINTVSNQAKAKILVPPQPFSVHGGDHMRLTLLSFEMRRNWYSVNQTNCVFYIYTPSTTTYQEIIIPPGSYDTFAKLAAAVQVGLRAAAATYALAECVFDESSRKLTFTLTGAAADAHLVCFQVKQGVRPAGVSDAGFFSDSYELLGLIPSRTATPTNATDAVGPGAHAAPFPCALNTLEAIYLRTTTLWAATIKAMDTRGSSPTRMVWWRRRSWRASRSLERASTPSSNSCSSKILTTSSRCTCNASP